MFFDKQALPTLLALFIYTSSVFGYLTPLKSRLIQDQDEGPSIKRRLGGFHHRKSDKFPNEEKDLRHLHGVGGDLDVQVVDNWSIDENQPALTIEISHDTGGEKVSVSSLARAPGRKWLCCCCTLRCFSLPPFRNIL